MEPQPFSPGSSALRLHATAAGQWSPQMTLSEFYWYPQRGFRFQLERLGRSARTLDQYDQSIDYWARYARGTVDAEGRVRTGREPPLCHIAEDVLSFQYVLGQLPAIGSPNTVIKHVIHVQAVLDRTGPRARERRLRLAVGLLDEVPFIEKPAAYEHEVDDDFRADEIALILGACRRARVPTYLAPELRPLFWTNLITVAGLTSFRIGSLVRAPWKQLAFRRDQWWLTAPAKGRHDRTVSVNSPALAAIEAMRPLTGGYAEIFHWPHQLNWLLDNHKQLCVAAGLPPERHCGFHGYRKWFCNTVSEKDAYGAGLQAGHSLEVMSKHYINRRRMAAAVEDLAMPAPKYTSGERQLELFDD